MFAQRIHAQILRLAENRTAPPSRAGSVASQLRTLSPATTFSRQLLSQDAEQFQPLRDITAEELNRRNQVEPVKKLKRTRLLLDARTELTDEELKVNFSRSCMSRSHDE